MKRADVVDGSGDVFSRVSDYVVLEILGHLVDSPWDLARFGATCRRMRAVATSDVDLWVRADPAELGSRCPTLFHLAGTLTLDAYRIGNVCKSLPMIPAMPHLRRINVISGRDEDVVPVLDALPSGLETLFLFAEISCAGLRMALEKCSNLTHLKILQANAFGSLPLAVVWESAPKGLRRLHIESPDLG